MGKLVSFQWSKLFSQPCPLINIIERYSYVLLKFKTRFQASQQPQSLTFFTSRIQIQITSVPGFCNSVFHFLLKNVIFRLNGTKLFAQTSASSALVLHIFGGGGEGEESIPTTPLLWEKNSVLKTLLLTTSGGTDLERWYGYVLQSSPPSN